MEQIDQVVVNFNPSQLSIMNVCLGFLMFGVALDLRLDSFGALLRQPRGVLTGLFSQLVLLPLLTLALVWVMEPGTSLALGMLLVAVCPGGNMSNFAVHLAGANSALSVAMTSISTLAAVVVTPLYFGVLVQWVPGVAQLPTSLYVPPWDMAGTIVRIILVPLALGMSCGAYLPALTARLKGPVRQLSLLIFVGFVVFAVLGNIDNIQRYLHVVFLLVLLHNALALLTGYWFARLTGLPRSDARTISLETGIQNSGLGLILIFNFFNGLGGMALVAAFWSIWHLVSALGLALWWQRHPV